MAQQRLGGPVKPPTIPGETAFIPVPKPRDIVFPDIDETLIAQALEAQDYAKAEQLMNMRERIKQLRFEQEQTKRLVAENAQKLQAIQDEIERRAAAQDNCDHKKPNGYPAIGGQRDSRGDVHYLCLNCNKFWVNDELPLHLRNNLPAIGGPA